jgi:hypothetical protein
MQANKSIKEVKSEKFRRLTGVKPESFAQMVEIIEQALKKKKAKGGRPNKLSVEQMLRMTLEYLREYRTYFHISTSYGISESNCYYAVKFVEEALIKSGRFKLPGRKALVKSEVEYEIVVIDASESPIERPKKSKENTTQGKRSGIHTKHS